MGLVTWFRGLTSRFRRSGAGEMRSIVIMQRRPHRFSEEELIAAAERGWGRSFDGKENPMYFVFAGDAALTVVKAGTHAIRVTSVPARYADDDEHALSQLPQPDQKAAWTEHHACVYLDYLNDLSSGRVPRLKTTSDVEVYSLLAKLAQQLDDSNCAAILVPIKNIMMPNDGTAEQGLRLLIKKELPIGR